MKTIINFLSLVALLSVFNSCQEKDENMSDQNFVLIDNNRYNLPNGFIRTGDDYGTTDYLSHDIILTKSDLSFNEDGDIVEENIEYGLIFHIVTRDEYDNISGEYPYYDNVDRDELTDESTNLKILNNSYFGFDKNNDGNIYDEDGEYIFVREGYINVSINGSTYDLDFEMTFEGGEKGSGNFSGELLIDHIYLNLN